MYLNRFTGIDKRKERYYLTNHMINLPAIGRRLNVAAVTICVAVLTAIAGYVPMAMADIEEVAFSPAITIAEKKLTLIGVGNRTYLWYRVITGGLYLERPTQDARLVIESEQIKSLHEYFRPAKVQVLWIRQGILRLLKDHNPEEVVKKQRANIDKFASWFDRDAKRGTKAVITYMPGTGLTLEYDGILKGTIAGKEFARMYFRSIFGEEADKKTKKEFLGIK